VLDEAAGVVGDAGDGLIVERTNLVLLAACGTKDAYFIRFSGERPIRESNSPATLK
jgi:hypothetical protein